MSVEKKISLWRRLLRNPWLENRTLRRRVSELEAELNTLQIVDSINRESLMYKRAREFQENLARENGYMAENDPIPMPPTARAYHR